MRDLFDSSCQRAETLTMKVCPMRLRIVASLVSALVASVLLLQGSLTSVRAATTCDTKTESNGRSLFSGMGVTPAGVSGSQATIEWFDGVLCIQTSPMKPSWALSWVSIDGPAPANGADGLNIFQGGFAKCANIASSCPYNNGVSYYWYYFARQKGVCGSSPFNTGVVKAPKGNASSGSLVYKIDKRTVNGSDYYYFSIGGSDQTHYTAASLDHCWGDGGDIGPVAAEFQNEMLNVNDWNSGTVANHQSFAAIKYQNSTGWHSDSWTLGRQCDAHSDEDPPWYQNNWACYVSSTSSDTFYEWDRRS